MVRKAHVHKYTKRILKPINRIDNDRYNGSSGDRSFILEVCGCKHFKAVEYGDTKQMQSLLTNKHNRV